MRDGMSAVIDEAVDDAFAANGLQRESDQETASFSLDGDAEALARLVKRSLARRLAWGRCAGVYAIYSLAYAELERVAAAERRLIPPAVPTRLLIACRNAWRIALEQGVASVAA